MFRFNIILCLIFISAATFAASTTPETTANSKPPAASAKSSTKTPTAPPFKKISFVTLALNVISWGETVVLNQAGLDDKGHANLVGNSITLEREVYFLPRLGVAIQGGYIFGDANVGKATGALAYGPVKEKFTGLSGSMRLAYRFSSWVIVSAGPVFVQRSLGLPNTDAGVSASSGASFNYGGTADLRLRLAKHWELREEIGKLTNNASTIWAIGLGYKF